MISISKTKSEVNNELKRKIPTSVDVSNSTDYNSSTPMSKKRIMSPSSSTINTNIVNNIPDIGAAQTTDFMIKKFVAISNNDKDTINPLFQSIEQNSINDVFIESSTPIKLPVIPFPLTISPIKPQTQPTVTLLVNETFLENATDLIAILSKDYQIVLQGNSQYIIYYTCCYIIFNI